MRRLAWDSTAFFPSRILVPSFPNLERNRSNGTRKSNAAGLTRAFWSDLAVDNSI